jgi:hypothetical protein
VELRGCYRTSPNLCLTTVENVEGSSGLSIRGLFRALRLRKVSNQACDGLRI